MSNKQTQQEFINKSIVIFGNQLDYSRVNYINSNTLIVLICKEHGEFSIKPKDHISYQRGCSICSGVKYNTKSFIKKSIELHGNKFLYDKVVYKGVKIPITIVCKIHGDFLQTPDKHINRLQGCPKCKKSARKNLSYVIKMGSTIHNNKYDYSKVIFTKMFDDIIIICPKHGEFKQTPANHINNKQNCPACMIGKSKKEEEWLDNIGLPKDFSHRTVILHIDGRRLIVDGFDPNTNTVYEFYGDFWHGNPNLYKSTDINDANHISFGQLYNKTLVREQLIIKNSYKLITIWEQDYDRWIKEGADERTTAS